MRYKDGIHAEATRRTAKRNNVRYLPKKLMKVEVSKATEDYLLKGKKITVLDAQKIHDWNPVNISNSNIDVDLWLMGYHG